MINEEKVEEKQIEKKKEITEEKEKDLVKAIILRSKKELINQLKQKSKEQKISLNSYINFALNFYIKKEEPLYEEAINKLEKKEVESRVHFTKSEAELLRRYAEINEWSMSREVRFRTILSLAKKPKLSNEELKAIYSVRSSINILGVNINRLIRNDQVISDHNIAICKELSDLIMKLQSRINWLVKCSNTNFKLRNK